MSTDAPEVGGKTAAEAMVAESHAKLPERAQAEQFDFLDTPSPEDMARAEKDLKAAGAEYDQLDVLDEARRRKKSAGGRKPGSRNRRTKDFERFLDAHGIADPALVLGRIMSTPAEVHVQRSKVMDPVKKQLTYGGAQALITRAAEAIFPYKHGKKPVQVELRADGDFNLIIPGVNASAADAAAAAAGEFVLGGVVEDGEFTEVEDGE